jgi:hypothetical protein
MRVGTCFPREPGISLRGSRCLSCGESGRPLVVEIVTTLTRSDAQTALPPCSLAGVCEGGVHRTS